MFICKFYVDGVFVDNLLMYANSSRDVQGLYVDDETLRPFEFSRLQLTGE